MSSSIFPITLKNIQCVKCHTMNWFVLNEKNNDNQLKLSMNEWEIQDDSSTNKSYLIHNPGLCNIFLFVIGLV